MNRLPRFSSFAALALAAGLLAACSGQYAAEKRFWRASRTMKAIAESPEATPPALYAKAQGEFEDVIRRYPDSPQATQAQMAIGELLTLKGDTETARAALNVVLEKYAAGNRELQAKVRYALAHLDEREGRWDLALSTYTQIEQEYPDTLVGLQTPLYVARHYRRAQDPENAQKYYEEAARYYRDLQSKHPRSRLALAALEMEFQCWAEQERWKEALDALNAIRKGYPGTQEAARATAAGVRIMAGLKHQAEQSAGRAPGPNSRED